MIQMEWKRELAKELLAPRPKTFPRRKVYASKVNEIWTADLMDVHRYAAVNKGMTFILVVVDVYSRFAFARGIKQKTGECVAAALKDIMKESKKIMKKKRGQPAAGGPERFLWTDDGKEFFNQDVKALLAQHKVKLYSTHNTVKASIAERFIRTLRIMIEREYILTDSTVWYKCLPRLILEYNKRKHRTIKMSPLDALKPENKAAVYASQFEPGTSSTLKSTRPSFYIGQRVRTSLNKKLFEKGSTQNWTEEIFRISDIVPGQPTTYRLEDLLGDEIIGSFYKEQLRPMNQSIYRVERVLKRHGGQALVKWTDYDSRHNSWVSEASIHRSQARAGATSRTGKQREQQARTRGESINERESGREGGGEEDSDTD